MIGKLLYSNILMFTYVNQLNNIDWNLRICFNWKFHSTLSLLMNETKMNLHTFLHSYVTKRNSSFFIILNFNYKIHFICLSVEEHVTMWDIVITVFKCVIITETQSQWAYQKTKILNWDSSLRARLKMMKNDFSEHCQTNTQTHKVINYIYRRVIRIEIFSLEMWVKCLFWKMRFQKISITNFPPNFHNDFCSNKILIDLLTLK